ncbi:MAG: glycosyltransferase [Pseudomonadales bacterium]
MTSTQSNEDLPLAIVTPWYGNDMKGGAEQQARELALRISASGRKVDVLTTCSGGFLSDWAVNSFSAGVVELSSNLRVVRFPVSGRDPDRFNQLNSNLLAISELQPGISPVSPDEEKVWLEDNIHSVELEAYLLENDEKYQAVIFLPYLYGTTLRGVEKVSNAYVMPCLHDEVYAYLDCVFEAVSTAKGLLFLSEGEQLIASRIFGPLAYANGTVVGAGVEPSSARGSYEADYGRFVLCLGRRSAEKGTSTLVEGFSDYRRANPNSDLNLVLAGPGEGKYQGDGIYDLGLVSEDVKTVLLANSVALFQPSRNESFSRVIYEAWFYAKPVVVNFCCDATRLAVEASRGGWVGSDANWQGEFDRLESTPPSELRNYGTQGKEYSLANVTWDAAIAKTLIAIDQEADASAHAHIAIIHQQRIIQLLPNLSFGDAISNQAIFLFAEFQKRGYESQIMVRSEHIDPRVAGHCISFRPEDIQDTDHLIYHHSIGSEITPFVESFAGRKCMIYHNITPPEFFLRYRPEFARLLRDGLEELWGLADSIPVAFSDSFFNASDLVRYGFNSPKVLPLPVDPKNWLVSPDKIMMASLRGKKNIVFVGRYSPNKRQVELVKLLGWLKQYEPNSRLVLAGFGVESDPYMLELRGTIAELGLEEDVILTGHISLEELLAVYRSADIFLSLSQHEGFGVPLLEAMWFDIPVVAVKHAAIGETLAGAGLLVSASERLSSLAKLVAKLLVDSELRHKVLARQRQRRVQNLPSQMQGEIDDLLRTLVS